MSPRKGDWFLTYTGRQFYPLDPRPEDISIFDVAHHLSLVCRFNGACRVFYSVAQHSCVVADHLPLPQRRGGLMHDSPEFGCGDVVRPLKYSPGFREPYLAIEDGIWHGMCLRFEMHPVDDSTENPIIRKADNRALMTERRDLMAQTSHVWSIKESPYPEKIEPWSPERAEMEFLQRFFQLFPKEVPQIPRYSSELP